MIFNAELLRLMTLLPDTNTDRQFGLSSPGLSHWFAMQTSPANERHGFFVIPVAYLWAIMTTLGLVMGWQAYQVLKQYQRPHNYFTAEAANQLVDCYVWAFMAIGIWQLMRWLPVQGRTWKRQLIAHIGISLVVSPIATLLYIAVIGVAGLGRQDMTLMYRLKLNLRGEWIPNAIEYLTILAILVSVQCYRRYREDQDEKLHLNRALTEAKLHALRAQLNPHFLFNALNSVSCLVHRDSAAADRMLANVANLLRLTLARDDSKEVSLLEEVEIAEEYLEIQRIRFGSRLKLNIEIADDVLEARVPNMLLQPLVENACVHGVARTRGDCQLEIRAHIEAGRLVISTYNDGPPLRPDWKSNPGIGLRNTAERLYLLYGSSSDMELSNSGGGVCLTVKLPLVLAEHSKVEHSELPVIANPVQPTTIM
jgi:hypothetical protein